MKGARSTLGVMLAMAAGAGCLPHGGQSSAGADLVETTIRRAYRDSVRRVQHGEAGSLVRTALAAAPVCPWEESGTGGYLMIIDDRNVSEQDAIVFTTLLCNQPSALQRVYRRSERWELEHRGGRWEVLSRTPLQENER